MKKIKNMKTKWWRWKIKVKNKIHFKEQKLEVLNQNPIKKVEIIKMKKKMKWKIGNIKSNHKNIAILKWMKAQRIKWSSLTKDKGKKNKEIKNILKMKK